MIPRDQPRHHADALGNVLRRARFKIRRQDSERGQVGTVGLDTAFRDGGGRLAGLLRSGVDLVVDIREVARLDDTPEAPLQQATEHVEHDCPAGIADLGEVADGWPADIHRDMVGARRRQKALSSG